MAFQDEGEYWDIVYDRGRRMILGMGLPRMPSKGKDLLKLAAEEGLVATTTHYPLTTLHYRLSPQRCTHVSGLTFTSQEGTRRQSGI